MLVAGFEDETEAVAEWHRLAGLVRSEGWDVDETRIAMAFWFGDA